MYASILPSTKIVSGMCANHCFALHQKMRRKYENFTVLINVALVLQLIVAAALTALGASNSNHRAVTAFGGVNTVIAGFLTYLKGSGLPNRFVGSLKVLLELIRNCNADLCACARKGSNILWLNGPKSENTSNIER